MKLKFITDDFSTVKEFVHAGQLTKLKLVWGIFEWKWMYSAECDTSL